MQEKKSVVSEGGKRRKRTIPQVLFSHTTDPRSVVSDLLSRSYEAVENGAAVVVDDGNASESRFDSFRSDSNHLTIHRCGRKA